MARPFFQGWAFRTRHSFAVVIVVFRNTGIIVGTPATRKKNSRHKKAGRSPSPLPPTLLFNAGWRALATQSNGNLFITGKITAKSGSTFGKAGDRFLPLLKPTNLFMWCPHFFSGQTGRGQASHDTPLPWGYAIIARPALTRARARALQRLFALQSRVYVCVRRAAAKPGKKRKVAQQPPPLYSRAPTPACLFCSSFWEIKTQAEQKRVMDGSFFGFEVPRGRNVAVARVHSPVCCFDATDRKSVV